MKIKLSLCFLAILLLSCNSKSNKKDNLLQSKLDSIETANNQSILDSGDNITKAYIFLSDSSFALAADMKKDHRFYGYKKPDVTSKKLILFSIFSNDVDGNPFNLPLGAYYDTRFNDDFSLKYSGEENGFTKVDIVGKKQSMYFERKWIIFDEEFDDEDESIREFGLIEKIEDSGYPNYIVTVNFVDKRIKIDFNLNIESVSLDASGLVKLKGKYASINYTSDFENNLQDLHFKGKSLQGKYAPEKDDSWEKFTGILGGAENLSGDLPRKISLTNSLGEKMTFEYFVDDETQKVNGKTVTAYYYSKVVNKIVDISPSEN